MLDQGDVRRDVYACMYGGFSVNSLFLLILLITEILCLYD